MNAQTLIARYREKLAWPSDEALEYVAGFIDELDLVDDLIRFLRAETGVDVAPDDGSIVSHGKPFAVIAFGQKGGKADVPAARIDTDSEVLALQAFSQMLERVDLEEFVIVQFSRDESTSRELLRYDRKTAVETW